MGNVNGNSSPTEGNKRPNTIKTISNLQMKLLRLKNKNKAPPKIHQDCLKVQESKYNGYIQGSTKVYLTKEEIQSLRDTLPYITMYMHDILNEAFIAMFTLNPDIKDKFFSLKDVTIEELRDENHRKFDFFICVDC